MTSPQWGDDEVPQRVVNITNIDPTLGQHGVRISTWQLVVLVCLSTMDVGLLIGLLGFMR